MKSPAFQFYPADWLSSQRVALMSLEEEGAYIRLLSFCWQHGSIPSDPEKIACLIGKGASTTLATTLATMFEPGGNGLIHPRLEDEREKQKIWREKSTEGGKKSAAARRQARESNNSKATLEPPLQGWLPNGDNQTATLQSPSTSSNKIPPNPQRGNAGGGMVENAALKVRLGKFFNRRESTRWDEKELKALKSIVPIDPADVDLLEKYYSAIIPPDAMDCRRKNLVTLLNNWNGELDRANVHYASQKS